ncbi:MAG: YbjN domain-containing protein [Spirochaetia bacterium]|nr:YbjN domain-containing protein [Spirochaetia bacterium]
MLEIFDGFIAAITTETKIPFIKEEDGKYYANIEFEGGRKQRVLVSLGKDDANDPLVHYYSVICKIKEDDLSLYKDALKINVNLDYGAIALLDDSMVIHQTMFLEDMDPKRFIKSLLYVAAKADELEEALIQVDES